MSNNNSNLILNTWIEEITETIAAETFNLAKTVSKPKDVTREVLSKVIGQLIELSIGYSLTEYKTKPINQEQAYEMTKKNYLNLKKNIQLEIAMGFERAFFDYTGRAVDYYCDVNPIPEGLSKETN